MPSPIPARFPAGYAAGVSVAFVDADGGAALVSPDRPLPISAPRRVPPPDVSGTATATFEGGAFAAAPGLPVWVTLAGEWRGRVALERAVDEGPWRPLTVAGEAWAVFTAPAHEAVGQEERSGVRYRLVGQVTGTLAHRVSQ